MELRGGGTELGHAAEQEKTRGRGDAAETVEGAGRIEERGRAGVIAVDVEGAVAFDVHAAAPGRRHPFRRDRGELGRRAAGREGGDERERRVAGQAVGDRGERKDLAVEHERALAAGVGEERGADETARGDGRVGFAGELHGDATGGVRRELGPG